MAKASCGVTNPVIFGKDNRHYRHNQRCAAQHGTRQADAAAQIFNFAIASVRDACSRGEYSCRPSEGGWGNH